eukprot:g67055.t1
METSLKEVQVRFVSKQAESGEQGPAVPDTPFTVPVRLGRYGLSEIVNHLKAQDPPRPYDFLIKGQFLRSDLRTYLQRHNISGEEGLELEYVEAFPQPEPEVALPHPDWVSAVDGSCQTVIVTGCYDGAVRFWQGSSSFSSSSSSSSANEPKPLAVGTGHSSAVKATKFLRTSNQDCLVVSAAKDQSLRVWRLRWGGKQTMSLKTVMLCKGHEDSVECLAVAPSSGTRRSEQLRWASAGWDGKVLLWSWQEGSYTTVPAASDAMEDEDEAEQRDHNDSSKPQRKKRRTESQGTGEGKTAKALPLAPAATLSGHTQGVTGLVWPLSSHLYSASSDQSIRMWDVRTEKEARVWHGRIAVTSLCFSEPSSLLATGHPDHTVHLWDSRQGEETVLKLKLQSHTGWVSSVHFCPSDPKLLCSGGYDKQVKLWDIRSSLPLHSLEIHTDKVLCVDWHVDSRNQTTLLSGSADKSLRTQRTRPARAARAGSEHAES